MPDNPAGDHLFPQGFRIKGTSVMLPVLCDIGGDLWVANHGQILESFFDRFVGKSAGLCVGLPSELH
jgi:hypothetical protein